MKYGELIQFEPINEVVKFGRLGEDDYRSSLVRNFVFSQTYEKTLIPQLCKNLDYTASYETFGTQIVGNYGTGKSHLMSLISLVAENEAYLPLVQSDSARKVLGNIAGKYRIIRFELGSDDELWRLVCNQIDAQLHNWGIDYSIANDRQPDMYIDKLKRMMAHFEDSFPNKGLMIVVDEMLSYLMGRNASDKLNRDLAVLQALGQMSDHSKFRMVFGVQELIYTVPEFAWISDMLNKVADRYRQIEITKQDVQFVVQKRILNKTDDQRRLISQHLQKFTEFFTDLHANFEEYVNLFPVHPSFFENFQQIKIGKSQRQVLKTLSAKFEQIENDDVPTTEPGLICYDSYWDDLQSSEMQTYPDIRRVTEIMGTVHQKIDDNFTGARSKKAPLAHRIANACAVKILQDSLTKTNGAKVENLVDDLCYLDSGCFSREFLIDVMNSTAKQIVTATVGQYFEHNTTNEEYHLRVEGGVNYEQKIKDFAVTMTDDNKDSHFFNFVSEHLPVDGEQYRREFKIYAHRIEWKSHKTTLDGYIFFGNPNERSTTHPQQNFYIYFMPIFNKAKMQHGNERDSIYIHLDKVSDEMKSLVELYAAAESLYASVDSSQKPFYDKYRKDYETKLKAVFNTEFARKTEFVYMGEVQTVHIPEGVTKEQAVSEIASNLLEDYFCEQMPDYPKFTLLRTPLTTDNRALMLKGARQKIANPSTSNRDGEAILAGLGLLHENTLSIEASIYAQSVKAKLEAKGEGQVLNRDEILYRFYKDWDNDWRSEDFHIGADLEFLVLSTMVAVGEIEISLPGKTINAANLRDIIDLPADNFYNFSFVRKPKGMNIALVRKIFMAVVGKDLTAQLQNPETYSLLSTEASKKAAKAVKTAHDIADGIILDGVEVITPMDGLSLSNRFKALSSFCDKLQTFNTQPKLSNLPAEWTSDSLQKIFESIGLVDKTQQKLRLVDDLRGRLNYLGQAKSLMTSQQMVAQVEEALAKLPDIVAAFDDGRQVDTYKTALENLISSYADWYLAEYKRMHINGMQDTEKRGITQGKKNKVCEAVFRADHGNGYLSGADQYAHWSDRMMQLSLEKPSVNRAAVLSSPYQDGFDPKRYVGKQLPKLSEQKEELDGIYDNVVEALRLMLCDPRLLDNRDALDDSQQGLLDRFTKGGEELSPQNAERLVEIVAKLHKGIQKIDITTADLQRSVFNRPMTPDDAVKAFRKYINLITNGKDNDNVRIVFK